MADAETTDVIEAGEVLTTRQARGLAGTCDVPGSSEVSKMAMSLAARSEGETVIGRCSNRADVRAFAEKLQAFGVEMAWEGDLLETGEGEGDPPAQPAPVVVRVNPGDLHSPETALSVGRCKTEFACIAGLATGLPFPVSVTGDPELGGSLKGIVDALEGLGAILRHGDDGLFPLDIAKVVVKPGDVRIGAPDSATKAAVFLSSIGNGGPFALYQDLAGDNDIEVLFRKAGARIEKGRVEGSDGYQLIRSGEDIPKGATHVLPGDAGAAACILTAAAVLEKTDVEIQHVGNDWRTRRFLDLLRRMNANISIEKTRTDSGFSTRSLHIKGRELRRFKVSDEYSALFMNEAPLLAVAGACGVGQTVIREVAGLQEEGRNAISLTVEGLRRLDVRVGEMPDGLVIEGAANLQGAEVDAGGDPRVGIAFAIAGLAAEGETTVVNPGPVEEIYPGVLQRILSLAQFRRS